MEDMIKQLNLSKIIKSNDLLKNSCSLSASVIAPSIFLSSSSFTRSTPNPSSNSNTSSAEVEFSSPSESLESLLELVVWLVAG